MIARVCRSRSLTFGRGTGVKNLTNHLHVILAANELGYIETALEACLSAKEVLQAIRETLLTPRTMNADPFHDYDS